MEERTNYKKLDQVAATPPAPTNDGEEARAADRPEFRPLCRQERRRFERRRLERWGILTRENGQTYQTHR